MGAEAAYRAAIAAGPEYAGAYHNLGALLFTQRQGTGGAEAAYRTRPSRAIRGMRMRTRTVASGGCSGRSVAHSPRQRPSSSG